MPEHNELDISKSSATQFWIFMPKNRCAQTSCEKRQETNCANSILQYHTLGE